MKQYNSARNKQLFIVPYIVVYLYITLNISYCEIYLSSVQKITVLKVINNSLSTYLTKEGKWKWKLDERKPISAHLFKQQTFP